MLFAISRRLPRINTFYVEEDVVLKNMPCRRKRNFKGSEIVVWLGVLPEKILPSQVLYTP